MYSTFSVKAVLCCLHHAWLCMPSGSVMRDRTRAHAASGVPAFLRCHLDAEDGSSWPFPAPCQAGLCKLAGGRRRGGVVVPA